MFFQYEVLPLDKDCDDKIVLQFITEVVVVQRDVRKDDRWSEVVGGVELLELHLDFVADPREISSEDTLSKVSSGGTGLTKSVPQRVV
jgi:hypothetical protein